MFLKSQELITKFVYKYYQLNLFLDLTEKFDQKSNFHPRMA